MDIDAIETKLTAARAKLILDKPFLGALVLRLPMAAADPNWCATTATDARKFYYNPEYIDSLSMSQTQFMLAHEALHCALSHFARRQHRIQHRWDLACDYAINPLLLDDGLTPPPNCNVMPQYLGMTAEEIYPLIDENDQTETVDQHLFDQDNQSGGGQQGKAPDKPEKEQQSSGKGGDNSQREDDRDSGGETPLDQKSEQRQGQGAKPLEADNQQTDQQQRDGDESGRGEPTPPPLSNEERQTLEVQWQQRLAGAAQQAMQAGKMGGTMARLVDHLLQPQLPWRMLLARYMTAMARDDFSYMRPSRREGDAILPSLKSSQVEIVVAIDTSGSIRGNEMDEFLSEVSALKGQMRARVTLLACDTNLAEGSPWIFEPWEEFTCPTQIAGGGGTDFRPVFKWLDEQGSHPELLVYFTDAQGQFPEHEPNYPVIWLVKGKETVPWGQRIQLN
ncbi:vWA domain-containing protein [Thiosocius teredinicola]|uniref:vWA domain-containing protein n=1 Tax=Thiosocius teredinicola TaxID=1973002 RepID=UPI0009912B95